VKEPCCGVSYTLCKKEGHIPGGPIWMVEWLPKGLRVSSIVWFLALLGICTGSFYGNAAGCHTSCDFIDKANRTSDAPDISVKEFAKYRYSRPVILNVVYRHDRRLAIIGGVLIIVGVSGLALMGRIW